MGGIRGGGGAERGSRRGGEGEEGRQGGERERGKEKEKGRQLCVGISYVWTLLLI